MQTQYTLSNGASIIQHKRNSSGDLVVLANTGGYHPFVTWRACASDKDPNVLDCYWGHYFADLSNAVEDFVERSSR